MKLIGGALFLLLFIAAIAFSVWLHFAAPCDDMKWMPAKDIPGRCLMGNN